MRTITAKPWTVGECSANVGFGRQGWVDSPVHAASLRCVLLVGRCAHEARPVPHFQPELESAHGAPAPAP